MSQNNSNDMPTSLGFGNFGSEENGDQAAANTQGQGDELDQLAGEMDESTQDNPLERDLGWEKGKEETEVETDEDAEKPDESEAAEEDVDEEEPEGGEQSEQEDIEEQGQEDAEDSEEEELLYDAERDFPDSDVQPTKYKDRIALNSGFTEKVRYLRDRKNKLEESDSRLGAIPLPDYFGDNEDMIDQVVDRESFASLSDEEAKKAIHDMDVAIKRANGKLDRVGREQEARQQKQQVSREYEEAVENLSSALDTIGLPVDQARNMGISEINAKADEAISALEDDDNAQEFISENGPQAWRREIQKLEQAKQTVSEFPDKHRKFQEQAKRNNAGPSYDAELTKETYKGFKGDRPDHQVFEGETQAREEDFLEYVRGKIERQEITPPQHERDWAKQADNYVGMIEAEKKQYMERKKKSSNKSKKNKDKTAEDSPVKKNRDEKPSASDINGQRSRRDVVTTRDIDSDLSKLASEMN